MQTENGYSSAQITGVIVRLHKPTKGPITVKLTVDGRETGYQLTFQDTTIEAGQPYKTLRWDLSPFFTVCKGSFIGVQLRRKRRIGIHTTLAKANARFQQVVSAEPDGEIYAVTLSNDPTIVLEVAPPANYDSLELNISAAAELARQRKSVLGRLGKSRGFLETLLRYGSALSELDPVAKALLGCVNVVYSRLEQHEQADQHIVDLAESMARAIGYIEDVEQFARASQLKRAIEEVRPLIEETANFIVSYTSRSATASLLHSDDALEEIESLNKRFTRFKEQFDRGVAVNTGTTLETLITAFSIRQDEELLTQLMPRRLGGTHASECMDGTREDVFVQIDDWLNDFAAPNILWIRGFPGVGKSAIASTLITKLRERQRLGSSFVFDRAKATVTTPSTLWRSVAYDLARLYPTVRKTVLLKLDEEIVDAEQSDSKIIFQHLIEDALKKADDIPVGRSPVIVVDALDECGGLDGRTSRHRVDLLKSLRRWPRVSSRFKLIVTSRTEDDISRALAGRCEKLELHSGNSVCEVDIHDIQMFFTQRFGDIAQDYNEFLPPDWPGQDIIQALAARASGLFLWAKTVVDYVSFGEPQTQLRYILQGTGENLGDMAYLYATILDTSFRSPTPEVLDAFKSVVGAIIIARNPLRRSEILALLDLEPSMVEFICKGLQSVMEPGKVLRFSHQSFVDFIRDSERCPPPFYIDEEEQHIRIAFATLRVMRCHLVFNICNIPTSHFKNSEIPDLEEKVEKFIPGHLVYACRFWVEHAVAVEFNVELISDIQDFMTNRFLYWLEVLSMTNQIWVVIDQLGSLIRWCEMNEPRIIPFLADALKFVSTFGAVIAQSAPHIYISALPFAPARSLVAQQYLPSYPQTLLVETGKVLDWPDLQLSIDEHFASVNSVSCSHDGRYFATASADKTLLICDTETGQPVVGPLIGHESSVNSVAFSLDDHHVASGSDDQTVRIWDLETGEAVSGPLSAHKNVVTCVAFSPNGRHLASGSQDDTIILWDFRHGTIYIGPLIGHTDSVTSLAFSHGSSKLVSGSYDMSVRVWDSFTGDLLAGPFQHHTGWVNSVTISPNGLFIASASEDETVCIIDAHTGELAGEPLEGHKDSVTSVGYSPDGQRIVSGSHDETVRVWDVNTGFQIQGPYRGHTNGITSVCFSKGGRKIFSASRDETTRVWDATTHTKIDTTQDTAVHTDGIMVVALSKDNTLVASGSDDDTVRVWDLLSGSLVAGPFVGHASWVQAVVFTPDGQYVISGSEDQTIRIWDIVSCSLVSTLEGHRGGITSLAITPDGRSIISGSYDQAIKVWEVPSGNHIIDFPRVHEAWVTCVAVSPNGQFLASGSYDKSIYIWVLNSAEIHVGPITGHSGGINCIAFSHDSAFIASGSGAGLEPETVRVWDVNTGDLVFGPYFGHTGLITSVAFSPDNKWVISSAHDKTIRIWDTETGSAISGPFDGHTGGIYSLAYSTDAKHFVSCSDDETIRVWDAEKLEELEEELEELEEQEEKKEPVIEFNNDSWLENGWIMSAGNARLFWVPPWNRSGLWWPRNRAVISERPTRLDLTQFVHGEYWEHVKVMLQPNLPLE